MELAESGVAPGGTHRNLASMEAVVSWAPGLHEMAPILLADAQTSGGLLISVPASNRDALIVELESAGVETRAVVGEIVERQDLADGKLIHVAP
jgi:selenide,water dikinase